MSRHHPRHSSSPVITLYDVNVQPGYSPQPWAPNIWRVRFVLNYKRLAYRTSWVEFADVEATLRSISAPPSAVRNDGRPVYTLPVIVDPTRNPMSPVILSNANNISEYLESAYPSRPLFPEGSRALQSLFVHYIQEVFAKPLLPVLVPLSHQQLSGRDQAYLRATPTLSTTYDRLSSHSPSQPLPPGPLREQAWLAVKEQFDFLDAILSKNSGDGDGIVAMGHEITYADLALCSVLIWIKRVAPQDGWSRIRHWNAGRWEKLWERCKPYMQEY